MGKLFQLILLLFCFQNISAQIIINEFQAGNNMTVVDPDYNEYADWIELYNPGTASVDLTGYSLTDEKSDTTKWVFPAGTIIAPNSYLVIWADNRDTGLHAGFNLDKNGDDISLFSASGELIDFISFVEYDQPVSIGRNGGNANIWNLFSVPSPGEVNAASGLKTQVPEVLFSSKSGFHDGAFSLELFSIIDGARICYTTNGSEPDYYSNIYSTPISIHKNTVVKVKLFHASYEPSRITTKTFFIGERMSEFPVISIGVDDYDMFDETYGMYALGPNASSSMPNYGANFWEDWELPATFEYFVNGKQKVEVNAGIKIFGGWSRRFPQKSFSINCRSDYGSERMRYKFFKDKSNDVYKQVVIRNAGNEVFSPKYRDLMIQNTVSQRMDIDYQAGQPTVVYINGVYWGIMNLREKLTERYLKDNYDLDSADVDLLANYGEVVNGDDMEFDDMFNFFDASNMAIASNYEQAKTMMDVNEFMNYQISEIFVSNHDWPGFNIKYWQEHGLDTKWRWILYDTDQSFNYYADAGTTSNTLNDATTSYGSGWPNPPHSTLFLRRLLENMQFRNLFIQRFAAHMNTTFAPDTLVKIVNHYEALYGSEKPHHLARWNAADSLWNIYYEDMLEFAENRTNAMRGFINDQFNLGGLSELTINAVNRLQPEYDICGVAVEGQGVAGMYFNNVPFELTAIVPAGLTFSRWEYDDGTLISTDKTISVTINSPTTVVAIFEEISLVENIFINEFMASNASTVFDSRGEYEDWIELYNDNDYPVDIAGLYITDDLTNPSKYMIPISATGETIIPAKGYLILWADSDESQGATHIDMKLSALGEQVGLIQIYGNDIHWIDSTTFGVQITDVSMSRSPNGSGAFVSKLPSFGINNDMAGNARQTFEFVTGWNIISFYLTPLQNDIESIFGGNLLKISIIKNNDSYYIATNESHLNTLGEVQPGFGYLVHAKENFTLAVEGMTSTTGSIGLKSGWNLIGCPWNTQQNISELFDASSEEIYTAKDFDYIYNLDDPFNTLETIVPGKGYFINIDNSGSLSW